MPVIFFTIQGLEKISITFTKYVNNNQQGIDSAHPKMLEKIPPTEAKNPKIGFVSVLRLIGGFNCS